MKLDTMKPTTPAPTSPTYAAHYPNWTDRNRSPAFATWEAEIQFARRMGYELVPSMYHIPHWFVQLGMDAVLPKLYVLRPNAGQFEELRSSLDCMAADLAYPLFFKPLPVPEKSENPLQYRHLTPDDTIREGDEMLNDDAQTWERYPLNNGGSLGDRILIGARFNPHLFKPIRRPIQPEAAQDANQQPTSRP